MLNLFQHFTNKTFKQIRVTENAPVAQLDRAPDYGSGGLGFESLRVHKLI